MSLTDALKRKEYCHKYYLKNKKRFKKWMRIWYLKQRHPCPICGKNASRFSKLCKKCYFEQRDTNGNNNSNWKGGKKIDYNGYILIYSPYHPNANNRKYVPEHRLIMEKKLGRFLEKKEVVHHINGVKSDNRIENLMLFSSDAEHVKYHAKMKRGEI